MRRRTFIQAGLIGGALLAAVGATVHILRKPETPDAFVLDAEARTALAAIVPVMLAGALPPGPDAPAQAIARVQAAIGVLPLRTQDEIRDLFGLLTLGVSRRLVAGLSDNWDRADAGEIAAFLQRWRTHRMELFRSAYHGLHDLILGSWYGHESTWAGIGYPGPPKAPA